MKINIARLWRVILGLWIRRSLCWKVFGRKRKVGKMLRLSKIKNLQFILNSCKNYVHTCNLFSVYTKLRWMIISCRAWLIRWTLPNRVIALLLKISIKSNNWWVSWKNIINNWGKEQNKLEIRNLSRVMANRMNFMLILMLKLSKLFDRGICFMRYLK